MRTIVKGKSIKINYRTNISDSWGWGLRRYYCVREDSEVVDTPTYFDSCDIDYRLIQGDYFKENLIEKVEGVEDNCIIYYTDKIIEINDNLEEKSYIKKEVELLNKIEEERYNNYLGKESKKWYQFWK